MGRAGESGREGPGRAGLSVRVGVDWAGLIWAGAESRVRGGLARDGESEWIGMGLGRYGMPSQVRGDRAGVGVGSRQDLIESRISMICSSVKWSATVPELTLRARARKNAASKALDLARSA